METISNKTGMKAEKGKRKYNMSIKFFRSLPNFDIIKFENIENIKITTIQIDLK